MPAERRVRTGGVEVAIREWNGAGRDFVLVHGLASNAKTWEMVAKGLSRAGHHIVAVDQRGHGRSDKPETGYGFDEVTSDLAVLIEAMGLEQPVVAGQSWGGNVVVDFASRHPELLSGLVLVDGGLIDLASRPGATWETTAVEMKPPNLLSKPRNEMVARFRGFHPQWSDEQIELQMGNYETLEDGTIRPWLSLEHHMEILWALWNQRPIELIESLATPMLIAIAGGGGGTAAVDAAGRRAMAAVRGCGARYSRGPPGGADAVGVGGGGRRVLRVGEPRPGVRCG